MSKRHSAKYKLDRAMGENLWGRPKSPVNKRSYGPGQHGQRRLAGRLVGIDACHHGRDVSLHAFTEDDVLRRVADSVGGIGAMFARIFGDEAAAAGQVAGVFVHGIELRQFARLQLVFPVVEKGF